MTDEGCSPLCFLYFLCNFAIYDGFTIVGGGEVFVGEVSLPVQRWAVGLDEGRQPIVGFLQGLHGGGYGLAVMRQKLVHVHCLQIGLSGE